MSTKSLTEIKQDAWMKFSEGLQYFENASFESVFKNGFDCRDKLDNEEIDRLTIENYDLKNSVAVGRLESLKALLDAKTFLLEENKKALKLAVEQIEGIILALVQHGQNINPGFLIEHLRKQLAEIRKLTGGEG